MATAEPSTTPNPDALKFTLSTTLPAMVNLADAAAAAGQPFFEAVFAAGGVASVFGVNDFVTITRQPGADWDGIVAAVRAAAAEPLQRVGLPAQEGHQLVLFGGACRGLDLGTESLRALHSVA